MNVQAAMEIELLILISTVYNTHFCQKMEIEHYSIQTTKALLFKVDLFLGRFDRGYNVYVWYHVYVFWHQEYQARRGAMVKLGILIIMQ